jgi:hypothetical protein
MNLVRFEAVNELVDKLYDSMNESWLPPPKSTCYEFLKLAYLKGYMKAKAETKSKKEIIEVNLEEDIPF